VGLRGGELPLEKPRQAQYSMVGGKDYDDIQCRVAADGR
jgi:hypothetical protein